MERRRKAPKFALFVHLNAKSWFSFLEGASSPRVLARRAADLGQTALAITDTDTLAGVVQFARACKKNGIKPILGTTLTVDGHPLVLLAMNRDGYANLCDLLTIAHDPGDKPGGSLHQAAISLAQLEGHTDDVICLTGDRHGALTTLIRDSRFLAAEKLARQLKRLFPDRLYLELALHRRPGEGLVLRQLVELAGQLGLPVAATAAVRHAAPDDLALHDALTCSRLGLSLGKPHPLRPVNAANHLKSLEKMTQWAESLGLPADAITNTIRVAERCNFKLIPEELTAPEAKLPDGMSANRYLKHLCHKSLKGRYPRHLYPREGKEYGRVVELLRKEIKIIEDKNLEEFFLVVREVVNFARTRSIRCAGRGSAANSIVAYLLHITEVDPIKHHLLFERFLHPGRKSTPDIDVDFDSSRRDEVIDWVAKRWGDEHTAMTANLIPFRLRRSVREMAKVLGYPQFLIDRLAQQKVLPSLSAYRAGEYRNDMAQILGDSPMLDVLIALCNKLHDGAEGCPRHLSLHSGGMILSHQPLRYFSPIRTSTNGVRQAEFDKDAIEELGIIKLDILGLRTMGVVSEAAYLIEKHRLTDIHASDEISTPLTRDSIPVDIDDLSEGDDESYKLIRSGETLGLFQIESPGQWHLLSRTQPQDFDDLIAQVALFRPGPLQGGMVNPYVERRRNPSLIFYLHPSLQEALIGTCGIIIFQEQVLDVAHYFAGMSLDEADEFRRLMSKFRDPGEMEGMREKFVTSAIKKHENTEHPVSVGLAHRLFDMVARFVGYGFCRSHAAAFARIVYQTAYLKAHFPAAYMAGLLEHKPSFYPTQTQLEEARRMGIKILPPCVLRSGTRYDLERYWDEVGKAKWAIRVALTQVSGFPKEVAQTLVQERKMRPFEGLRDLYQRIKLDWGGWENLARSGTLNEYGERREVLWQLGELAQLLGPSGQQPEQLFLGVEKDKNASLRWLNNSDNFLFSYGDDQTPSQDHQWDMALIDEIMAQAIPELNLLTQEQETNWDFQTMGITTGPHPIARHRAALKEVGALTIEEIFQQPAGTPIALGGAVISRQRPPTAKGMAFLIFEDETGRLPTAITPQIFDKLGVVIREPSLFVEGIIQDAGKGQKGKYRSLLIRTAKPLEAVSDGFSGGYRSFCGEMAR